MSKLDRDKIHTLEYCDIVKNRKTILQVTSKDFSGKFNWRDLQKLLGSKIGVGTHRYSLKLKNDPLMYSGQIRGVSSDDSMPVVDSNESNQVVLNKLSDLEAKIKNQVSPNDMQMMIVENLRTTYEIRIGFLNDEIQKKDTLILKLETKIDELNADKNDLEDQLDEYDNAGSLKEYLPMLKPLLDKITGSSKPVNLSLSDPTGIPESILKIIGMVDWNQVPPEQLKVLENYLTVFIQKLPLKNSEGSHGKAKS